MWQKKQNANLVDRPKTLLSLLMGHFGKPTLPPAFFSFLSSIPYSLLELPFLIHKHNKPRALEVQ